MIRKTRVASAALAALLATSPAWAGWTFEQTMHTTSTGAHSRGPGGDTQSRLQIEGGDARVDFIKMAGQPGNPMLGKGGYMLLRGSAPKGLFMINADKKTYTRFDPAEMSQALAPAGNAMGAGGMKMSIDNPKVEKVLEEAGPTILGYSTTHYRFHKTYTMSMNLSIAGTMVTAHDSMEDVWVTSDIHFDVADFGDVMKRLTASPMLAGMEKLAALEPKLNGFPLKRVIADHTTPHGTGMMSRVGKNGQGEDITMTVEITDVKKGSIDAGTFAIPAGYSEAQMMQPGKPAPDLEDH